MLTTTSGTGKTIPRHQIAQTVQQRNQATQTCNQTTQTCNQTTQTCNQLQKVASLRAQRKCSDAKFVPTDLPSSTHVGQRRKGKQSTPQPSCSGPCRHVNLHDRPSNIALPDPEHSANHSTDVQSTSPSTTNVQRPPFKGKDKEKEKYKEKDKEKDQQPLGSVVLVKRLNLLWWPAVLLDIADTQDRRGVQFFNDAGDQYFKSEKLSFPDAFVEPDQMRLLHDDYTTTHAGADYALRLARLYIEWSTQSTVDKSRSRSTDVSSHYAPRLGRGVM